MTASLPGNNQTNPASGEQTDSQSASKPQVSSSLTPAGANQQQMQSYPQLTKDEEEAVGSLYKEGEPRIIEKKEFQPAPEVKKYVKEIKKEEAIELPVPIEDEYGQVLMESVNPTKAKIILPLNRVQMKIKKRIVDSWTWLKTWCIRIIKMFPGRVQYKDAEGEAKGNGTD